MAGSPELSQKIEEVFLLKLKNHPESAFWGSLCSILVVGVLVEISTVEIAKQIDMPLIREGLQAIALLELWGTVIGSMHVSGGLYNQIQEVST